MNNPFEFDSERAKTAATARSSDSISLAFLFYVVTIAAIVAACANLLIHNQLVTWPVIWTAVFVCAFVGGILGTLFSNKQTKSVAAISLGGILGAIVGVVAGLICLIEPNHYMNLMSISFGGSFFLVVLMLVAARFQKHPNV